MLIVTNLIIILLSKTVQTKKPKLVQVSGDTYDKLRSLGKYGDTFDSIVVRLLERSGENN